MLNIADTFTGDFGLPEVVTSTSLIPYKMQIVSEILSKLFTMVTLGTGKKFSYCIGIDPRDKVIVQNFIIIQKTKLPVNVELYEVDGRTLFETRGKPNGMVFYLITK